MATPETPSRPENSSIPEKIGKYRIIREIGHGGMGTVYEALDETLGRKVALKVLPHGGDYSQFESEATNIGKLDHPNIVPIYEFGQDQGCWFIAMKYIDGRSFSELLRKEGPFTEATAANYTVQAAGGLNHAHERSIIHRDVKPSNIIEDTRGRVCEALLVDFGLAKYTGGDGTQTAAGVIKGTPGFIAPESMRDVPANIHSDIYALGATLYVLLTGKKLFAETLKGGGTQAMIAYATKVSNGERPTPIRKLFPKVSESIETIVETATDPKPENRFQNMREMIQALFSALQKIRN